jgi:hypothetical protein
VLGVRQVDPLGGVVGNRGFIQGIAQFCAVRLDPFVPALLLLLVSIMVELPSLPVVRRPRGHQGGEAGDQYSAEHGKAPRRR